MSPKRKASPSLEALLSSKWPHWTSPNDPDGVLDRVRRIGPIALDPCGNLASKVGAGVEYWGTPEIHADMAEAAIREEARRAKREPRAQDIATGRRMAANGLLRAQAEAEAAGRTVALLDGLGTAWAGVGAPGLVYVNPPYGRQLPRWVETCADEADKGAEVVLLVPARTDTAWCHDHVFAEASWRRPAGRRRFRAHRVAPPSPDPRPPRREPHHPLDECRVQAGCFVRGRYNFDNPPAGSERPGGTFPPLVAYYGDRAELFFAAFEGAGELFRLQAPREVTHVG